MQSEPLFVNHLVLPTNAIVTLITSNTLPLDARRGAKSER